MVPKRRLQMSYRQLNSAIDKYVIIGVEQNRYPDGFCGKLNSVTPVNTLVRAARLDFSELSRYSGYSGSIGWQFVENKSYTIVKDLNPIWAIGQENLIKKSSNEVKFPFDPFEFKKIFPDAKLKRIF